jgi:SOS-response transcriptional repressor LexA
MSTLTSKQHDCLEFLKNFIADNGYAPTLQTIAENLRLKSLGTVHKHLTNLEHKGYIARSPNRTQSIEIMKDPESNPRFTFEGKDHLWDSVEHCYWIRKI